MIKTLIFRCEDVILNLDILWFKIYEKLWYYLRHDSPWEDFEEVLKLREFYITETGTHSAYTLISQRYLPERDYVRFISETGLFLRKMGGSYLRLVPQMTSLVRNLRYYYKIVLVAEQNDLITKSIRKFALEKRFHHIVLHEPLKNRADFVNPLRQSLRKSRAEEAEAILISNRLSPDIAGARMLNIFQIKTAFDPAIRGFMAQNTRERQFVASIGRVAEYPEPGKIIRNVSATASSPAEISRVISQLEKGEKPKPENQVQKLQDAGFWDLVREILNPPMETGSGD